MMGILDTLKIAVSRFHWRCQDIHLRRRCRIALTTLIGRCLYDNEWGYSCKVVDLISYIDSVK